MSTSKLPLQVSISCHECGATSTVEGPKSAVSKLATELVERTTNDGWETLRIGRNPLGHVCPTCVLQLTGDAPDEDDEEEEDYEDAQAANLRLLRNA